jgi:hypothetical protein
LFGLLQGTLFVFVMLRLGEISAAEQARAIGLSVGIAVVGVLAGAGLAAFTALLFERRRRAEQGGALEG